MKAGFGDTVFSSDAVHGVFKSSYFIAAFLWHVLLGVTLYAIWYYYPSPDIPVLEEDGGIQAGLLIQGTDILPKNNAIQTPKLQTPLIDAAPTASKQKESSIYQAKNKENLPNHPQQMPKTFENTWVAPKPLLKVKPKTELPPKPEAESPEPKPHNAPKIPPVHKSRLDLERTPVTQAPKNIHKKEMSNQPARDDIGQLARKNQSQNTETADKNHTTGAEAARAAQLARLGGDLSAGAAVAPRAANTQVLSARYKAQLEQAIYPHTQYAGEVEDVVAVVKVRVDANGRVLAKTLQKSSGNGEWDASVLRAVTHANPLPPPENNQVVDIILRFNLSRAH